MRKFDDSTTSRLDQPPSGVASPPPTANLDPPPSLGLAHGLRSRSAYPALRDEDRLDRPQTQPVSAETGATSVDSAQEDDDEQDGTASTLRWGYALLGGSTTCFALGLWSMLIGPLCGPTGLWLLDALAQDTYYKYLAVLLIPVTVCFVIVNWWGLKIFRHA